MGSLFYRLRRSMWRAVRAGLWALYRPFLALEGVLRWLLKQFIKWVHSRELRNLLYGLPALFVMFGSAYVAGAAASKSSVQRAATYQFAARQARSKGDLKAARLYYDRLVSLNQSTDSETMFELATVSGLTGDTARAALLIRRLAPDDRPGFIPAHMAVAENIVRQGDVRPEQVDVLLKHLRHVLAMQPNHQGANTLLGVVYFRKRLWEPAVKHLLFAGNSPDIRLMLGEAYSYQGDAARGSRLVEEARDEYAKICRDHPENVDARLQLAEALLFLKQYSVAVDTLSKGISPKSGDRLKSAIAKACVLWYDDLNQSKTAPVEQLLEVLEFGVRTDSKELLLFDRLIKLLRRGDEDRAAARERLLALLAEGRATSLIHLVLGTDAALAGELSSAEQHLERALSLDNDMSIVANNLAWFLAFKDPPELDRAEKLITQVLAKFPAIAPFRDTRGQILVRQGKFREALDDLEFALPTMRENARLHQSLAEAYSNLNMTELAAQHQRLAERLQKPSPSGLSSPFE